MSPDLYQPDYPEKVGTIWVPIYYVPLEMEQQQQQRNNTTPMGMASMMTHFENEEIVNVIQSDEELEVDVESDEERVHEQQKKRL